MNQNARAAQCTIHPGVKKYNAEWGPWVAAVVLTACAVVAWKLALYEREAVPMHNGTETTASAYRTMFLSTSGPNRRLQNQADLSPEVYLFFLNTLFGLFIVPVLWPAKMQAMIEAWVERLSIVQDGSEQKNPSRVRGAFEFLFDGGSLAVLTIGWLMIMIKVGALAFPTAGATALAATIQSYGPGTALVGGASCLNLSLMTTKRRCGCAHQSSRLNLVSTLKTADPALILCVTVLILSVGVQPELADSPAINTAVACLLTLVAICLWGLVANHLYEKCRSSDAAIGAASLVLRNVA